jgi:hypothetical protein
MAEHKFPEEACGKWVRNFPGTGEPQYFLEIVENKFTITRADTGEAIHVGHPRFPVPPAGQYCEKISEESFETSRIGFCCGVVADVKNHTCRNCGGPVALWYKYKERQNG